MKALAAILTLGAAAAEIPQIAPPEGLPEEISRPFDEAKAWSPGDPKAWSWEKGSEGRVFSLERQSGYKPPVRSPINLAWFEEAEWRSFELTAELLLTKFDQGNNDLCIAFGGGDASHFYYAHLGEKADEPHHQIHIVDGADRKPVTTWRTEGTPWKEDRWHKVRVVRNADTGGIGVWFDGELVLAAADKTFDWGRIGLGSFDDTGKFRALEIRGERRPAE